MSSNKSSKRRRQRSQKIPIKVDERKFESKKEISQMLSLVEKIEDRSIRDKALITIAKKVIDSDPGLALEIMEKIEDPLVRASGLIELGMIIVDSSKDEALAIAESIRPLLNENSPIELLEEFAVLMSKIDLRGSLEWIKTLKDENIKNEILTSIIDVTKKMAVIHPDKTVAKLDSLERSEELAYLIKNLAPSIGSLAIIDDNHTYELLEKLYKIAQEISDSAHKDAALSGITLGFSVISINKAMESLSSIKDNSYQQKTLREITNFLAQLSYTLYRKAKKYLNDSVDATNRITDIHEKLVALSNVSYNAMFIDQELAMNLLEKCMELDENVANETLSKIAKTLAKENLMLALELTEKISDKKLRDETYAEIIKLIS